MKKDKILVNIASLSSIPKYEDLGITNFLFPLTDYSIGYKTFNLKEIENSGVDAYILMNRLLTDEDIDNFLKLKIPSNVRGFVIEDTGLYMELKDSNYTLINFQNHLNANYKTCNYWLNYFDSLVVSTDITTSEIEKIVDESSKPLVIPTFGYPMIMYSRRHLITNYYRNFDLPNKKEITIEDPKGTFTFHLYETDYGTACFTTNIRDARMESSKLPEEKVLFYLFDENFIPFEDMKSALQGKEVSNTTKGFLNQKTVYRIGDLK